MVNHTEKILSIFISLLFAVCIAPDLIAFSITDMPETETVYNDDTWKSLNLKYSTEPCELDSYILNFDVSDDGDLAVATANEKIILFDKNAKFIGSMSLDPLPFGYRVFWHGSNLCVLITSEDEIVELSSTGNYLVTKHITDHSTGSFDSMLKGRRQLEWKNLTYKADCIDLGFFNRFLPYKYNTFSRITRIDNNSGEQIVVFDSGESVKDFVSQLIWFFAGSFLFIILVGPIVVFYRLRKFNKEKRLHEE